MITANITNTMDIEKYSKISEAEAVERILAIKKKLGTRLALLAHNYQQNEIFKLGDVTGDSLELSRKAKEIKDAEYIVFAGVRFMAETARVLAADNQKVFLPNLDAGCPMADMGEVDKVERAWKEIQSILPGEIIPMTYVNSSAELKAFCGRHGGVCCTSGNAENVFKWAYKKKKRIMFFPDEYLGRNTGNRLKVFSNEQVLWDSEVYDGKGGIEREKLERARLILWKGFCHVHTFFKLEHIEKARKEHPDAVIIVHPECPEEIVQAADLAGSTKFMEKYVSNASPNVEVLLGTEVNMAKNLSYKYPDKNVSELTRSLCPNMHKVNVKRLLFTLENLPDANEVTVSDDVKKGAILALERMFEATP